MPQPTNTERIGKLEQLSATLDERLDTSIKRVDRLETVSSDFGKILERYEALTGRFDRLEIGSQESLQTSHVLDKKLALAGRDIERLERRLDEFLVRRYDLWKLFLAAILGGVVTVAAGFVLNLAKQQERPISGKRNDSSLPPKTGD